VKHSGSLPLYLELESPGGGRTLIRAADEFKVSMDDSFRRDLADLLGDGHAVLAANSRGRTVKV